MRFLADESCDFSIVRALRAAGHDVVAVREVTLGADDDVVLELAVREGRVLLTKDNDFASAGGQGGDGTHFKGRSAHARHRYSQLFCGRAGGLVQSVAFGPP